MSDAIFEKLNQMLKEIKPSTIITRESDLREDLDLDSLDIISFFFEVEGVFNIKISETEIEENGLLSIGRLIDYINKKIT